MAKLIHAAYKYPPAGHPLGRGPKDQQSVCPLEKRPKEEICRDWTQDLAICIGNFGAHRFHGDMAMWT